MISVNLLCKHYKKERALDNVSFQMKMGMLGLLGPNGAGKSTLLKLLAALLPPTSGDATVFGHSIRSTEAIHRMIGYLPQFYQLHPQLTGIELLDHIGRIKGIGGAKQRKAAIDTLLEQVNMTDKAREKIRSYSNGMKQRIGIAQALLGDPKVIIADEPTTGLDPEERVRLRNLMARFSEDRIVILSTHVVADIESSCTSVAVLNGGKLQMSGTREQLQALAKGRVWELEMTEREFASQTNAHRNIVSVRRTENGLACKLIAYNSPSPYAIPVEPSLEDGYLALIGGESA